MASDKAFLLSERARIYDMMTVMDPNSKDYARLLATAASIDDQLNKNSTATTEKVEKVGGTIAKVGAIILAGVGLACAYKNEDPDNENPSSMTKTIRYVEDCIPKVKLF